MKLKAKITIADHFAQMEDPRIDRIKRHKLIDIITIAVCAVICGRYVGDMWGAARVEDTYNLLGHALRKVLEIIAENTQESLETVAATVGAEIVVKTSLKAQGKRVSKIVIIHPAISNNSNNAGIAVILFDLSATLTCPKTRRCSLDHALTKVISEKENTCVGEFRHFDSFRLRSRQAAQCIASLNSRSLSWLSEVETNGGGIFIPVNRLSVKPFFLALVHKNL